MLLLFVYFIASCIMWWMRSRFNFISFISGIQREVFSGGPVSGLVMSQRICSGFCFAPTRTVSALYFQSLLGRRGGTSGLEISQSVFSMGRRLEGTDLGWISHLLPDYFLHLCSLLVRRSSSIGWWIWAAEYSGQKMQNLTEGPI